MDLPENDIIHPGQELHRFILENVQLQDLTETFIANHTHNAYYFNTRAYQQVVAQQLQVHHGVFLVPAPLSTSLVSVLMLSGCLELLCGCDERVDGKMCSHQALALNAIVLRTAFTPFFDDAGRLQLVRAAAADYGLEQEPALDDHFTLQHHNGVTEVLPRSATLLPVTPSQLHALYDELIAATPAQIKQESMQACVVLREHKYYRNLQLELYHAAHTKSGKLKNPLQLQEPLSGMWNTADFTELKLRAAIYKFQQPNPGTQKNAEDLEALRALINAPVAYAFYYHNHEISEQVAAASLVATRLALLSGNVSLDVTREGDFYKVCGYFSIGAAQIAVTDTRLRFSYFVLHEDCLYLIPDMQALNVIGLLQRYPGPLLIHHSRYARFQSAILSGLERSIDVHYSYIEKGTEEQLLAGGFKRSADLLLYLSDSGNHILLTPVVRYSDIEIPVRTKRQVYTSDDKGQLFTVARDHETELNFISLLIRQHALLAEQLAYDLDHFYLPKTQFLDADWFLNAFDEWRSKGIVILGFNELEGNKLNPHKAQITIRVESGFNWFNALVAARFGRQRATLKQLHKAIRNRSKYVQLDDGSQGILPAEWIDRFSAFFNAGEITADDTLQIPRINFAAIDQLYESAEIDSIVQQELLRYHERMSDLGAIREVPVPETLQTILRPYQRFGLSWLDALDELNFGGCLADDMGLGKSVQIIAFMLLLQQKGARNPHLLVVPTSLIANWQQELNRFAPALRVHILYGADRRRSTRLFEGHDLILTSYGTLLSDIGYLQDYTFDYVFLDESQQIKNPDAQRYRAAQQLRARNRIIITGTPVENNTFDLYAQLSFACPGLLGSKQYFRDIYAIPVDQFKISKRARELQEKIRPFILRRTKQQVAPELPEKTEVVLYCPMQPEQRRVYNAYEKEFRDYVSATSSDEVKKNPMHALKGLTRLRQVCDSAMLLPDDMLRCEASAKLEVLLEQLKEKATRHKILVFSQFVSMLDLIRKRLEALNIGFSYLTGASRNRGAIIDRFQQDDGIRVFLISLKAGGTGLNLTQADYVFLVDPWWNPAVENQAIDRAHRIGQDKKVVAVRLICPDTVEDKMLRMQQQKRSLAQELITPDNSVLLSKEVLLGLLDNTAAITEEA